MKERYKKLHKVKYRIEQHIGTTTHIRVYHNEGQSLIVIHPYLMSNLEGILPFFRFPVNSRLFGNAVKILIEFVQRLVKVSNLLFSRLIGCL